MYLIAPEGKLISAHDCIPFTYANILIGEPAQSLNDTPYEIVNITMWQGNTMPFIQDGDYIVLDGARITFTTGTTVVPYLVHCDPSGVQPNLQAQMANDVEQCLIFLYPEYTCFTTAEILNEKYVCSALRNTCGVLRRSATGGFRDDGSGPPSGPILIAEAFLGGVFNDNTATIAYELLHNTEVDFIGTCNKQVDTGILYVKPDACDCLNAASGTANIDVSSFLRAQMRARFPTVTAALQTNILNIKPEMSRFFRLRGTVTANNDYANTNENNRSLLSPLLQAYNGILQPNFGLRTGQYTFDVFTSAPVNNNTIVHLPLVLNPYGLVTCANQLRFAQWWVETLNSEYFIQVQITVFRDGFAPELILVNFPVIDFSVLPNSPMIFELNTGLPQIAQTLELNGITVVDQVKITSINYDLAIIDQNSNVVYDQFHPVYYNIERGCCCKDKIQFIFLSSLGSWETIVLEPNIGTQYEITSTDLDNCLGCTVPEPAQTLQSGMKTENRYLTEVFRATLHEASYYGGDVAEAYYDGSDYIKEFLNSRHVYLVKPQSHALGSTPSEWVFYRAVISNELPDITDATPTVISYRLYKNLSLER